jgi:hypothetical protein
MSKAVSREGVILLPGMTRDEMDVQGIRIRGSPSQGGPFVAGFDAGGRALFATLLGDGAYEQPENSLHWPMS